ncbi:MAG: hypothetical protein R2865_14640 [Deinococcales bacterium]
MIKFEHAGQTHDALSDSRNEQVLIYMNGEPVPRSEAKISVFDSVIWSVMAFGKASGFMMAYWFF